MTTTTHPDTTALAASLRESPREDADQVAALDQAHRVIAALRDEIGGLRLAAAQMIRDLAPRHGSPAAATVYYFGHERADLAGPEPSEEDSQVRQRVLAATGKDPWQCQAVDCVAFFPVPDMAYRHERREHPYITYTDTPED